MVFAFSCFMEGKRKAEAGARSLSKKVQRQVAVIRGKASFAPRPLCKFWRTALERALQLDPTWCEAATRVEPKNALGHYNEGKPLSATSMVASLIRFRDQPEHKHRLIARKTNDLWINFYGVDAIIVAAHARVNMQDRKNGELVSGFRTENAQKSFDDCLCAGFELLLVEKDKEAPSGNAKPYVQRVIQVLTPESPLYYEGQLRETHATCAEPLYAVVALADVFIPIVAQYPSARCGFLPPMTRAQIEHWALRARLLYVFTTEHAQSFTYAGVTHSLGEIAWDKGKHTCARRLFDAYAAYIADESPKRISIQTHESDALPNITAKQLGLTADDNGLPPLHKHLLPSNARRCSLALVHEWLCMPPPLRIARAVKACCAELAEADYGMTEVWPARISRAAHRTLEVLRRRVATVADMQEVRLVCHAVLELFADSKKAPLLAKLWPVIQFECDSDTERHDAYVNEWREIVMFLALLTREDSEESGALSAVYAHMRSTSVWRYIDPSVAQGLVLVDDYACAEEAYEDAREHLNTAYECSECTLAGNSFIYDPVEGFAYWKEGKRHAPLTTHCAPEHRRKGEHKPTTEAFERALLHLKKCNAQLNEAAEEILTRTRQACYERLAAIEHAWRWLLITQTLYVHTCHAQERGWTQASECEPSEAYLSQVYPYWMDGPAATNNDISLDSVMVLTGCNEGGKSTMLREVGASAVSNNCGFFIPCRSAALPRFRVFIRSVSSDRVDRDHSGFRTECEELRELTHADGNALLLVDEVGSGTSPDESEAFCYAMIQRALDTRSSMIFATHQHRLQRFFKDESRIRWKRLRSIESADGSSVKHTHKLEDGVCASSGAMHTIRNAGLDASILRYMQIALERGASEEPSATMVVQSAPRGETPERRLPLEEQYPFGFPSEVQFNHTIEFARELLAEQGIECTDDIELQRGENPPAKLMRHHALYVWHNPTRGYLYVGESENIKKRIEEHRANHGGDLVFHIFGLERNRTKAHKLETLVNIRAHRAGFNLLSTVEMHRQLRE